MKKRFGGEEERRLTHYIFSSFVVRYLKASTPGAIVAMTELEFEEFEELTESDDDDEEYF